MNRLVSLQKKAIDKDVSLLRRRARNSQVSFGCHNISTISMYFCA